QLHQDHAGSWLYAGCGRSFERGRLKEMRVLSRIPIRIRLSVSHAIWMALIFVAIGIGISKVVEDSVMQSLDATLLTSAKTLRDAQHNQKQNLSMYHEPGDWESIIDEFFGGRRY